METVNETKVLEGENENNTSNNSKNHTTVKITIDSSLVDVLDLNKDGVELRFSTDEGKFLELSSELFSELSAVNKRNYILAKEDIRRMKESRRFSPTAGLNVQARYATATSQLEVIFTDETWKKAHHVCWKRPDKLQSCYRDGYRNVTGSDPITTFLYNPSRDIHVVGAEGHEELILMCRPIEEDQKHLAEISKLSKLQSEGVEEEAKRKIEAIGGEVIDVKS